MSRKKGSKEAGQANVFVPTYRTAWLNRRTLSVAVLLLVIVIAGILFWYFKSSGNGDKATNSAAQQTLQVSLAAALRNFDYQTIADSTTQLINGAQAGRFSLTTKELAQLHLEKASALTNLKMYSQSAAEYKAAMKLDTSLKYVALQGEVSALYASGERKQLMPLMQQIVQVAKQQLHTQANLNGQVQQVVLQYQTEIQDLQNNKPIEL